MRDPARIELTLAVVRDVWLAHPDMRLGQLILGCVPQNREAFTVEDDALVERLRATYQKKGRVS